MWKDEIVEEVRKAREEYAAKFDHDIDAIYKDIKRREAESGREFVWSPPKSLNRPLEENRLLKKHDLRGLRLMPCI